MPKIDFKAIFTPRNRIILLDIILFVVNLILMIILARLFSDFAHQAKDDAFSKAAMGLFCLSLVFLQPIGAILKRRGAHQRNAERFKDWRDNPMNNLWILYFISQLMFSIFASVLLVETANQISGKSHFASLFVPLFFGIPMMAFVNTFIVYFYFLPVKHEPVFKFLASPQAELLGDICFFVNLICYQIFWLYLMAENIKDHQGLVERIFYFAFCAVFIYFPPRLFYVVENWDRPRAWLMMLAANLPIIVRVLFGASSNAPTP